MSDIVLATLNAKFIHASLGLRYLYANLGALRARADIAEFTLDQRATDIAEKLLARKPRILGLGVYIWNVDETARLVAVLKRIAPELTIVLGGPEVSYEQTDQPLVALADYVVAGQGDFAFRDLCAALLADERPAQTLIEATPPRLDDLELPYAYYTDADIAHRLIYVEASRGCPFKCEFCLSALDKTALPFDLDRFLAAMDGLYQRGARHFKFVDRTFNLNVASSRRILQFFLDRLGDRMIDSSGDDLFLHFEVIPDRLPDGLKELLVQFPAGSLQLEVGVQTFNPEVQALISRKQDNDRTEDNLRWLREHSHAHIHADLIVGLPGEDSESFGAGFDRLYALRPHEIQVGILKRLRGAPISRHTQTHGLRFTPQPPYTVLATDRIAFGDMQRLNRFARYWDLIGNSGRFAATLPLLLGEHPFARFLTFSDWLYAQTGQTHKLALPRLFELLQRALIGVFALDADAVLDALAHDCAVHGTKGCPGFLHERLRTQGKGTESTAVPATPQRQARHLRG
ncbi:MAG: DUF4080 domain-containing protein [Gammaproteobacteria bacterium]|nr:DUF4080 domain-containing protein [Gammaproteobacteria bacterium]